MAEPSAGEDRTREALGPSLPSPAGPLASRLHAHSPRDTCSTINGFPVPLIRLNAL